MTYWLNHHHISIKVKKKKKKVWETEAVLFEFLDVLNGAASEPKSQWGCPLNNSKCDKSSPIFCKFQKLQIFIW